MTIPMPLRLLAAAVLLSVFTSASAQATTQRIHGQKLGEVIAAIDADDWSAASRMMAAVNDDAGRIYFEWRRLRGGQGRWSDYVTFVRDHADWPGLPLLRKVGESKIEPGINPAQIASYFDALAPQTGKGALAYVQALESLNRTSDAQRALIAAWTTLPMSNSEQQALIKRYAQTLGPLHWQRTDHLIWESNLSNAALMLPLLSNGQRRLAEARIALRKGQDRVTKSINAIPASLQSDPGLAFDRFRWRMRRDIYDGAREMILERSKLGRDGLGRPDIWAQRRASLTRYYMRERSYKTAYAIAAGHHLKPEESGYTDLNWLAGYIALIYLDRPTNAVTHFRALRTVSVTPITQGRVWYWLGRAHAAAGNGTKAQEAYAVSARYQTSFYGQLAREAGDIPSDPILTGAVKHDWQNASFLGSTVFRAGLLLHYAGERYSGGRFFAHLAETLPQPDQERLGQLLIELDRPNMALRVAKNGAREGRIVMPAYYPVVNALAKTTIVPPELALAIARQETEMNPEVESPAGARGLMQLMPATARSVSRGLGLAYSADRLISEPDYNVRLGTAYLRQMLDRFDGSYVLAAAAYNAGPNRAAQWITRFGDPRKPGVDTVQWIEKIPFNETRNYVMRVMESVGVYRARLSGDPGAVTLGKDLARR